MWRHFAQCIDSPVVDQCQSESDVGKTSYGAVRENFGLCTCCSPVTTLCRFQCAVTEVCAVHRVPSNRVSSSSSLLWGHVTRSSQSKPNFSLAIKLMCLGSFYCNLPYAPSWESRRNQWVGRVGSIHELGRFGLYWVGLDRKISALYGLR